MNGVWLQINPPLQLRWGGNYENRFTLSYEEGKNSDAYTRNVTKDKFFQKVIEAEVKIIAITNHNQFDYMQYKEFKDAYLLYLESAK